MFRAHDWSLGGFGKANKKHSKKSSKKSKRRRPRPVLLESLEGRLYLSASPADSDDSRECKCECSCGSTTKASANKQTGHGNVSDTPPGQKKDDGSKIKVLNTNNTGTNPHPIVRFTQKLGDQLAANSPLKVTVWIDDEDAGTTDPQQIVYYQDANAIPTTQDLEFAVQIDTSNLATGRYEWFANLEQNDSGGLHITAYAGQVTVVNRAQSVFGNRRWLEGYDQLIIQDAGTLLDGALLVKGDGEALWYPYNGSIYEAAAADPEFATLVLDDKNDGDATNDENILTSRDGTVRTFDYVGKLKKRQDADGNALTYGYNGSGQLTTITDASDRVTTLAYYSGGTFNGLLYTATDPNGLATEYLYDDVAGPSTTLFVLTSTIHPDPDGTGPLLSPRTDFSYAQFESGFDWLLTTITAPGAPESGQASAVTKLDYDLTGRLSAMTYPDGSVELYDPVQTQSVVDLNVWGFSGTPAPFTKLGSGQTTEGQATDRLGEVSRFTMDRFGYVTKSIDSKGNATTYTRNSRGMVLTITEPDLDGAGGEDWITTFNYDDGEGSEGTTFHLLSITWADDSVRSFTYMSDGSHRLETMTDEVGRVTMYEYAGNSRQPRIIQQVLGADDNPVYQSDGSVTGVEDDVVWSFKYTTAANKVPGGLLENAFDPLGRKTAYAYYSNVDYPNAADNEYWGELKSITLPKLAAETNAPKVVFDYDTNGYVKKVTESGDGVADRVTEYLNDAFGRLNQLTLPDPDGTGTDYAAPIYKYFYNTMDQLTAVVEPGVALASNTTAPTISGSPVSLTVPKYAGRSEIDLTPYFDDDVDEDYALTYMLTDNSNPALVKSITFPTAKPGTMVVDYADNTTGTSAIKIKAIDRNGNASSELTINVTVSTTTEFLVNQTTTNGQRRPSLAPTADGGFVAAWLDKLTSPDYNLVARVFGPDGLPKTDAIVVRSNYESSTSSFYPPGLTVTGDGHFVVAWHEDVDEDAGEAYDVFFSRYTLDGRPDIDHQAVQLASDWANNQFVPMLSALPGGGFIAAFYGGYTNVTASEVWFRRFDATATAIDSSQVKVNVYTDDAQYMPSINVGMDGGFVIGWQGVGSNDSNGAFARKFDRAGRALTPDEKQLQAMSTQWQLDTDVAALPDGSYVIAYASDEDSTGTTDNDIFYVRMDASGNLIGSRVQVNDNDSPATQNQLRPRVMAKPDGGFLVTWYLDMGTNGYGVYAKPFDGSSFTAGTQFAVDTTQTGDQTYPDVIRKTDGDLVLAWEGNGTGDSSGIHARFYETAMAGNTGPFRATNLELGQVVRGKIDRFIVTFSEPIDYTSVATSDFSVTGATVNSVDQVSKTQVLVILSAAISSVGTFTVTVESTIDRASDDADMAADSILSFFYTDMPVTTYQYDAEGRVSSEIDATGARTRYTYNRRGQVTSMTDPEGRTTTYQYDSRGQLEFVNEPDPDGYGTGVAATRTKYEYDAAGNLIKVTEGYGVPSPDTARVTEYRYDVRHRLEEIEEPGSLITTFRYTAAGELERVVDPTGKQQFAAYDAFGRLTRSALLAADSTKETDDSPALAKTSGTDWSASVSDANALGGVHSTAPSGNGTHTAEWQFTGLEPGKTYEVFITWVAATGRANDAPYTVYDGAAGVNSLGTTGIDQEQSPNPSVVVFGDHGWHSLGDFTITGSTLSVRLANTTDGTISADAVRIIESAPTRYSYDAAGNVQTMTDAMGSISDFNYDERDRRISVYEPNPDTGQANGDRPHTLFSYDSLGNLKTLKSVRKYVLGIPVYDQTSWDYDYLERVKTETDPLNSQRKYKYDAALNLSEVEDRIERVTKYGYDAAHRLKTETWFDNPSAPTADRTINYAYNQAGQLIGVTDRDASSAAIGADYTYSYDGMGRTSQSTADLVGLGTTNVYQEFAYDFLSRRKEAKASYGTTLGSATKDYKNNYTYDAVGRLDILSQQGWGGNTVSEKYVDFGYNSLGQFTSIARYKDLDHLSSDEVVTSTFGYDDLGRLISLDHTDVSAVGSPVRASYDWTHNANGWLTSMDFLATWDAEDVTYAYDKSGQLETADRSSSDESYTYDLSGNRINGGFAATTDNRLTTDGTYNYSYDLEGNLEFRVDIATGAYTQYIWDHRNRLVSATNKTSGGSPTQIVSYEYDAFDRRISKTLNSNGTGNPERYEFYIWDGTDVVLDFVDADGGSTPSASLDMRYLHGPAVDQLLAQETVGGTVRWMLSDHQGTIRDVADNTGDTSGRHVVFDAFGNVTSGTLSGRFAYTEQEYDADTGLYYYNARWYNPSIGRFISKDAIGFAGNDTNLFRYVGNSPTNFIDSDGYSKTPPAKPPKTKVPPTVKTGSVLGIHCNADSENGPVQGHGWLSITDPDTGEKTYIGLWPDDHHLVGDQQDDASKDGSDVRVNYESHKDKQYNDGLHARYHVLTKEEAERLAKYINEPAYWTATNNCSSWASDGYYEATDEDVDADGTFGIEHPAELGDNIKDLEKGDPTDKKNISPKKPKAP